MQKMWVKLSSTIGNASSQWYGLVCVGYTIAYGGHKIMTNLLWCAYTTCADNAQCHTMIPTPK